MQTLIVATRNPHKTREFAELLGPDFSLRDLTSAPDVPEIVESGATFEENAELKAVTASRAFPDQWVIADDSGLEVDALGGAPGIYSARYAAAGASDDANVAKLLRELRSATHRRARFVCALAVARNAEAVRTFRGVLEGAIAHDRHGAGGFGYDPVFVPDGSTQTVAELGPGEKNRVSHRAKAARQLREFLARTMRGEC